MADLAVFTNAELCDSLIGQLHLCANIKSRAAEAVVGGPRVDHSSMGDMATTIDQASLTIRAQEIWDSVRLGPPWTSDLRRHAKRKAKGMLHIHSIPPRSLIISFHQSKVRKRSRSLGRESDFLCHYLSLSNKCLAPAQHLPLVFISPTFILFLGGRRTEGRLFGKDTVVASSRHSYPAS